MKPKSFLALRWLAVLFVVLMITLSAVRGSPGGELEANNASATNNQAGRPREVVIASGEEEGERDVDGKSSVGELEEDQDAVGGIDVDDQEDDWRKFSWQDHQDDHSLYAHRSLMSAEHVGSHQVAARAGEQDGGQEESAGDHTSAKDKASGESEDEDDEEYRALNTANFAEKEWQLMFRALDLAYDSVSASILQQLSQQTNLFDEIISRLQPQCRRDIEHIKESVKKHKLWALRMLDSNGKIPSGVTYGKFSSPGDYEECLSVHVDELIYRPIRKRSEVAGQRNGADPSTTLAPERYKFNGKYCLLDFRLPMPERPRGKLLSIHEPVLDLSKTEIGKKYPEFQNYSGYASVLYEVGYMHAFCLPSSCQVSDVAKSVGKALEGLHVIVNNTVDCEQKFDEPQPLRRSQMISLAILFFLFANATCASILHYLASRRRQRGVSHKKDDDDGIGGLEQTAARSGSSLGARLSRLAADSVKRSGFYTECFSVQTNFGRLTKPDPRGLTFVHYTRIVAMGLTVVTHTAGLGTLQAITKPADASNSEQMFRDLLPQMLANAFTSIQIFFFMAGFMLVISTYPSIKREKGHISFVEYAIKRAIRLMPGLASTVCLNFLWPLLVDGPMLSYFVRIIVVPCETNWWRTMAFLSNFDHVEKMCLRHSYFSASDYQLHLMAFPLLILLYKMPSLSLSIAALLTVGGFVAQVIMVLTKTVLPFMMVDYVDKEAFFNVVHYIHHPVWNHMSAFFYGFILGYVVVKQIRINVSDKTVKRIWCILMPLGVASIFAPYFWNHYKRPIYRWQMVLYVIFDRFALLTTCAWLSYATMVLARKPKSSQSRQNKQADDPTKASNLPDTVTLEQSVIKLASEGERGQMDATSRLRVSPSNSSIPRQRSSPNLSLVKADESATDPPPAGPGALRPAMSTDNLSSQPPPAEQPAPVEIQHAQQAARRKTQPPVSNVNTLCLMLSRLTFQLYLFNMVVLWMDVNHSKYFWFFSYYFIITKALAVYIFSSIMAMIFFVTLESPCLTLYIMWVKSRAKQRAKRCTAAEKTAKAQAPTAVPSENIRMSPGSSKSANPSEGFDGLCMRMSGGADKRELAKPSFSFIDLSTPHGEKVADEPESAPTDELTRI